METNFAMIYRTMADNDYTVRFKVIAVIDIEEKDAKAVRLIPWPAWEEGPEVLTIFVPDTDDSYSIGQIHFIECGGEDFAYHEKMPPPDWLELQYDLEDLVEREEYEFASLLRDKIQRMKDAEV